jgi:hypothetical protein
VLRDPVLDDRSDAFAPFAAVEDAVMADAPGEVILLQGAGQPGGYLESRPGLTDAGDVVALAVDGEEGEVTAPELMPMMAAGPDASFGPCPCPGPKPGAALAEQAALVEMLQRAERARAAAPAPEAPPLGERPSPERAAPPADAASEPR